MDPFDECIGTDSERGAWVWHHGGIIAENFTGSIPGRAASNTFGGCEFIPRSIHLHTPIFD
jgi:hypothetical protein